MANSLVQTKLYLPRPRRSLVARPRLSGRLSRGSDARLTLISAPAGFGKTTLLTAWLAAAATENRSVAWLSLDESDRQPATFWTYVITALQTAVPGIGADVLPLLQSAQPPIETVLAAVLNELAAAPNDVDLVLDDYHLVDGPDLRDGMTFLLEHLPPHVHLVISSRADPLLPLARLRARGELVEVRAADLRFTPDEVAAYLNDVIGLDLAPDDIAALEGRTEGWIAALQLAALSMQGRTDIGAFIAGFAGDDRYIVDYLVEEVLAAANRTGPHLPAPHLPAGPVERPALRRRDRRARRQGHPGSAGPRQPVPGPARRQPPLVPLSPPFRGHVAGPPQ